MKKFLTRHRRRLMQIAFLLLTILFAIITSSCTGPWA